ncbi:MAG: ABC transporter substrate-binding protein [Candidatus Aminicenantes bacterium]|nr:MAG: ABC transporter substrate-binding protein [Candidatus Aminicenantes bacterium]
MAKDFNTRAALIIFLVLSLALPLLNFYQEPVRKKPRYGGVFRVKSFANEFRGQFDPTSPESFIFVSEQIYDGLVKLDKNLHIVPCLAEYWEISPDSKKYTFYLRKRVKFHHGRELTAEDVKFSFERLLDAETNSPYYQFFLPRVVGAKDFREGKAEDVEGFKVLNKHTFEIYWTRPFVSALYLMGMHFCKILPKDLVLDQGRGFFREPSGTGPFKFDYYLRSPRLDIVGVRMKRYEEYFRGMPYLSAVEFSPHYTLDHFINDEIHSIPVVSERLIGKNYQVFQDGSLHPIFLGMSCHIPPLDNPAIRRAISYAIDKREMARATYDMRYVRKVINNFIPSRLPGFFPRDDENMFDIEKAKDIFLKTGFPEGENFPTLTLLLEGPRTDLKFKIYREIRRQLGALGVGLRLRYYRSSSEIQRFEDPYLIFIGKIMNFPDPEDIIRPLFFSKSVFNVFGYDNPELDRLLQEAEIERSWTKRIKLFRKIEEILHADIPAFPLFSHQNRVAIQANVRGLEVPPLGFYYLNAKKIWLDE